MTAISRTLIKRDEQGRPVMTGERLYVVECDTCGHQVEVKSDSGLWAGVLEPHGMTVLLYPDGLKHSCKEHLK